jgi:hypothetical protein
MLLEMVLRFLPLILAVIAVLAILLTVIYNFV